MELNNKILHLTTDEKFIDGIHYIFEKSFPTRNRFIVVLSPKNPPLRYIKNTNNLEVLVQSRELNQQLKSKCEQASLVIFHGMNYTWASLINEVKSVHNFMYIVWGAEVYLNPLLYKNNLYGQLTSKLESSLNNSLDLVECIKKMYRYFRYSSYLRNDMQNQYIEIKKALNIIPRIGVIYREEYELFKELRIVSKDSLFQKLSYYPLEFILEDIKISKLPGDNIWIGNSSALSNNHLEAFQILSELDIGNRKVVVPLSYGPKKVANAIKREGKEMFGKNFKPLMSFLPLNQYNELLQSSGIVIMNHYRQQAIGNIFAALYIGCKVFLDERNTVYHFLKRIGCKVFSVQHDLQQVIDISSILKNLTQEEVFHNRLILEKEIGEEALVNNLRIGML